MTSCMKTEYGPGLARPVKVARGQAWGCERGLGRSSRAGLSLILLPEGRSRDWGAETGAGHNAGTRPVLGQVRHREAGLGFGRQDGRCPGEQEGCRGGSGGNGPEPEGHQGRD